MAWSITHKRVPRVVQCLIQDWTFIVRQRGDRTDHNTQWIRMTGWLLGPPWTNYRINNKSQQLPCKRTVVTGARGLLLFCVRRSNMVELFSVVVHFAFISLTVFENEIMLCIGLQPFVLSECVRFVWISQNCENHSRRCRQQLCHGRILPMWLLQVRCACCRYLLVCGCAIIHQPLRVSWHSYWPPFYAKCTTVYDCSNVM